MHCKSANVILSASRFRKQINIASEVLPSEKKTSRLENQAQDQIKIARFEIGFTGESDQDAAYYYPQCAISISRDETNNYKVHAGIS